MPISGLVITLGDEPALAADAQDAIGREPSLSLGKRKGARLPAVADTTDAEQDERLRHRLEALPGVIHLDVVFVCFDPPEAATVLTPASSEPSVS